MMTPAKKITGHTDASEEERNDPTHQKAGDVIGVDDFDDQAKQFIFNWFGILTGARMHSKAVHIMDGFPPIFLPMPKSPLLPTGKHSKSYCFNRPTSEIAVILVDRLKTRGVEIYTTRVTNVVYHTSSHKIISKQRPIY